jgi:hypothetical protein
MPAGSPNFKDAESIERLYRDLNAVFSFAAEHFRPSVLTDFFHNYCRSVASTPV